MISRHDRCTQLWKKVRATVVRLAVRILFVPPGAQLDERLDRALKTHDVKPMPTEFFAAIKDFLDEAGEKHKIWTEVIKPTADNLMAAVWTKLWKTREGREYQELKAQVDKHKAAVDGLARRAEEGIGRKIVAGGRVVTFLKTRILIGSEDLIIEAQQEVERLKHELSEAKGRLKQLEKGKEDSLERINVLIVEQAKKPEETKSGLRWLRIQSAASPEEVQEAIVRSEEIDDLICDELTGIDGVLEEFVAVLENVAQQEITEEDIQQLAPDLQEEPVEVAEPADR